MAGKITNSFQKLLQIGNILNLENANDFKEIIGTLLFNKIKMYGINIKKVLALRLFF